MPTSSKASAPKRRGTPCASSAAALEQIRGELAAGRSIGHVVIATVTVPGGLVCHHQHVRDHTPDA